MRASSIPPAYKPTSPLSKGSFFCVELPSLPAGGMKPLPLLRDPEAQVHTFETTKPASFFATRIAPAAFSIGEVRLVLTWPQDPTKEFCEDTVYGPMTIMECTPEPGGCEIVYIDEATGEEYEGHLENRALSLAMEVPTNTGTFTTIISRVAPSAKRKWAQTH